MVIGVNTCTRTHSVPTVDQFLRVEWTARIPTVYVEFGSARYSAWILLDLLVVLHGARIYRCTSTVLVECAHLHESDLSTFDHRLQYRLPVLVPPYEYDTILPVELY